MSQITQLEQGIILKQPQQGPPIALPQQSIDLTNLTPAALAALLHPIGATMSAFLTLTQFQAQMGTGWIISDGSNVAGSAWATITGNTTVPDTRGLVLRGKNNGRADGAQNPDGEIALGTFQADMYVSHAHSTVDHAHSIDHDSNVSGGGGSFIGGSGADDHRTSNTNNTNVTVNAAGGNETRMKNVTVNHFIRIN